MKRYCFLKHQADIRLLVEADTLGNLLEAALAGMNELITRKIHFSGLRSKALQVDVESLDQTTLLIDFLSEILSESQTEYAIYDQVGELEIEGNHLKARIFGYEVGGFAQDIKAVTYHEADVKINRKGNYESVIVFDI